MNRKRAAVALSCVAAAALLCGWFALGHAGRDASALPEEEGGREETAGEHRIIYDTPAERAVPLYTQDDARWGSLPYAGADLATSGCGLTCAAMAWEWLSGEACTPADMLAAVGESCVQAGQNYMPGFCSWMQGRDPSVSYTVPYESRDRALEDLSSGRLVFGAMSGAIEEGGRSYGGHVVLLCGLDGGAVTVHDPCDPEPVAISRGRFNKVDWGYFISIGRG